MNSKPVFRIDRFTLPLEARKAFLERLETIQTILAGIEGNRQNLVLEQVSDPGTASFITIVEWQDEAALKNAKAQVAAEYEKHDFSPQEFMREHGVTAEFGTYAPVTRAG